MHARAAVFDLYGDHLRDRGGWAPVSSLIRLLGAVQIASPAVRTAVSRLVREGWLERVVRDGQRGYAATPRARDRLAEAWRRIYRADQSPWDGRWHVVVVPRSPDRAARARVAAGLGYLGYAQLARDTWVAPHVSPELDQVLRSEGLEGRTFRADYGDGGRDGHDGHELAAQLWDLDTLAADYRGFLHQTQQLRERLPDDPDPELAFATRTQLVHEWRKFLFRDPGLPAEVLPDEWPGLASAALFDETADALLPAARVFVDQCLAGAPDEPDEPDGS